MFPSTSNESKVADEYDEYASVDSGANPTTAAAAATRNNTAGTVNGAALPSSAFATSEQWCISNQYTIVKLLGNGAFGRVYQAHNK